MFKTSTFHNEHWNAHRGTAEYKIKSVKLSLIISRLLAPVGRRLGSCLVGRLATLAGHEDRPEEADQVAEQHAQLHKRKTGLIEYPIFNSVVRVINATYHRRNVRHIDVHHQRQVAPVGLQQRPVQRVQIRQRRVVRLALEARQEVQRDRLIQRRVRESLDEEQIELLRLARLGHETLHVLVEVVRHRAAKGGAEQRVGEHALLVDLLAVGDLLRGQVGRGGDHAAIRSK